MKKHLVFYISFALLILNVACSDYQKILKSSDFEKKYVFAKKYYNQGKYLKAQPLFDELLAAFRGSERSEDVYYFYTYNEFNLKNYGLAGYHFKNFGTSFPSSSRLEETEFMYAYCLSLESPEYSLDQTATKKGIEAYQIFINKFPNSKKISDANDAIDRLRLKLQIKAVENAALYYKMEDYRAAAISYQNVLREFPDIGNREEMEFLVARSFYLFAEKSLDFKKLERFQKAQEYASDFVDNFPQSKYLKEVQKIQNEASQKINILKTQIFNNQ